MSRFREVPTDASFAALERDVLARWEREGTFQRSIDQRAGGPEYVFYDGPPFATGLPHYGHLLTTYIKDVVPRYFTMRGHHVPRRWGWDCHGLPVELEIERELGFTSRAQILAHGIGAFNAACEASVLRYADEWRRIVTRLGRWVDFDNDYRTMDQGYMESVVWVFRSLHDKGLIYEGDKVVAYCTRCQTTLSNFEARIDDAFRPRQDPAITVRFRLASGDSVLAWTTTPWTLPSNVALAVGADIAYARYDRGDDRIWIAESRAAAYAAELAGYTVGATRLGRELVGERYEPLFPYFADTPNAFAIFAAEFVTTEDGTGIVHIAPAFGEDDHALCAAHGIAGPNPVQDDGTFDARVTDVAGQHVFAANAAIARALAAADKLFRRETCEHNYPHCWRCDQPLIYRAIRTWFVRVTAIKERMLAANQRIRWVPEHLRDGRFGNWLENARDWAVSRNRFWGAPIPVWRCDACGGLDVIGSRAELEQKCGRAIADWHRPAIDEPAWPCACGGTRRRVPDVLDCWFESGSMPYAQVHYPFENKAAFEAAFPGDFIVEYLAQTRGWFYTLVVLSTALFDGPPFDDVVCHGVILASDGRKMSKRLKNYPDPLEVVEQHGSDALRIALLSSAAVRGTDLRFSAEAVRDAVRRFCLPVWNSLHYLCAYARIDGFEPTGELAAPTRLDRYVLHETEMLRAAIDDHMARYDFAGCYDAIEDYIVMLSTWYIRLCKQRLWRAGIDADKRTCYEVLYATLSTLARVIAPFMPFLAESVHGALGGERSVHLEDWPGARADWLAPEIADEMDVVRRAVRLARSVREQHDIRHRHPLRAVAISGLSEAAIANNLELLAEELNVKRVRALTEAEAQSVARRVPKLDYGKVGKRLRGEVKLVQAALDRGEYELSGSELIAAGHRIAGDEYQLRYLATEGVGVAAGEGLVVVLDLTTDAKLVEEGRMRDLNRGLQDLRKQASLAYERRVVVSVIGSPELARIIDEHRGWLAEQVLATEIVAQPLAAPLAQAHIEVGDEQVAIALA